MKVNNVIVSVHDKTDIKPFAEYLLSHGASKIYATRGTLTELKTINDPFLAKKIKPITDIATLDNVLLEHKRVLTGKLKTLDTKIFGSVLLDPNDKNLTDYVTFYASEGVHLRKIDMVVINIPDFTKDSINENIDIGGPALLRAAVKNHNNVIVVPNTKYYQNIIEEMTSNNQLTISEETRLEMVKETMNMLIEYDKKVLEYVNNL